MLRTGTASNAMKSGFSCLGMSAPAKPMRLTGKPMIITTNIPIATMQKAVSLDERRIYDRILEVCVPIRFDGENFRRGNAKHNLEKVAQPLRD